jgi:DNA polymerase (family X)
MTTEKHRIEASRARGTAEAIVEKLKPHCSKIQIAGSLRRRLLWVHDIDIALVPANSYSYYLELLKMIHPAKPKPDGPKIKKIQIGDIPVDIYIATEQEWYTLLLIRTGSARNNIRLCEAARDRGWILKADGSGLFNQFGKRVAGDSEESIFSALGLTYQLPEERI